MQRIGDAGRRRMATPQAGQQSPRKLEPLQRIFLFYVVPHSNPSILKSV